MTNALSEATKHCISCAADLPSSAFYLHPRMAGGTLNKCKECCKRYARERRLRKILDPDWLLAERARCREKQSRYYSLGLASPPSPEASARWRKRNWHKRKAQADARRAVISGEIQRPEVCSKCGRAGKIHGHHHDYSKPLDVEWLCSKCHGLAHRKPIE